MTAKKQQKSAHELDDEPLFDRLFPDGPIERVKGLLIATRKSERMSHLHDPVLTPRRVVVTVFAVVCSLIAPGVEPRVSHAQVSPPGCGQSEPGGVFVTGHDPDFHASQGPNNRVGARRLIQVGYTIGK